MSIYSVLRPKEIADEGVTAPLARNAVVAHLPTLPGKAGSEFAHMRKRVPVNVVLPTSRRWLEGLPPDVRPARLVERYARVVNLIACEWSEPAAFGKLMAELLIDGRGGRIGFAQEIVRELHVLRDHYYSTPTLQA